MLLTLFSMNVPLVNTSVVLNFYTFYLYYKIYIIKYITNAYKCIFIS